MLAALWLFLWFYQGWPLRVCMMFVMGLGMIEVSQAFAKEKIWPCGVACMAFALFALPAYLLARQELDPFAALSPVLLIAMLCLILGMSLLVLRGTVDGRSLLATAFPILYPGLLFAMLFPLVDLGGRAQVALALGHALVIALANDLAAYEIGTLFGKRKLSPVISPKKTVEGSLAGFAAGILVACGLPFLMRLIWPQLQLLPVWMYALLGRVRQRRGATGRSFRLVYQARVRNQGFRLHPAGARGHYGPVGRGALLRHGLHGVLPLVWDLKERI